MTNKEILSAAQTADITKEDWMDDIMDMIRDSGNQYALGYMKAKLEELGAVLYSNSEDYHWEFMEALGNVLR